MSLTLPQEVVGRRPYPLNFRPWSLTGDSQPLGSCEDGGRDRHEWGGGVRSRRSGMQLGESASVDSFTLRGLFRPPNTEVASKCGGISLNMSDSPTVPRPNYCSLTPASHLPPTCPVCRCPVPRNPHDAAILARISTSSPVLLIMGVCPDSSVKTPKRPPNGPSLFPSVLSCP
jgi:hypothetical protein